jgi:hypothetical protein
MFMRACLKTSSFKGLEEFCEAQKNVIMKTWKDDQTKLNLRHLANDLVLIYVDKNSPAKPSEEK